MLPRTVPQCKDDAGPVGDRSRRGTTPLVRKGPDRDRLRTAHSTRWRAHPSGSTERGRLVRDRAVLPEASRWLPGRCRWSDSTVVVQSVCPVGGAW